MRILGVGGSSHDFSACLLEDGKLRLAIGDERITRVKHSLGLDFNRFSSKSIDYILDALQLREDDIDLMIGNDIINANYYRKYSNRMNMINHHLAHASSAFFVSPFEEAAILVIDGAGSGIAPGINETMTYYHGKGNHIAEIAKVTGKVFAREPELMVENSIGIFYDLLSIGLGFYNLNQGKTMGLAPYGTPNYVEEFGKLYTMREGQFVHCKEQYIQLRKLLKLKLLPVKDPNERFQLMADLAFAGQHHLEQIIIQAANYLYEKTGVKNLCLVGGVALNSVANYRVLENTKFQNLFIPPVAGDAGTAIGSAYYAHYSIFKNERDQYDTLFSPYLGMDYSETAVQEAVAAFQDRIEASKPDNIFSSTAKLLSEDKIIGWFQERSEIGPRTLDNRSILANPRNPQMKDIINSRIKHREAFRPFAPVVLEECQTEYFNMDLPSYYMLIVSPVQESKRLEIPAVTHIDGTGRVQTISNKLNPRLHQLVEAFRSITGTPEFSTPHSTITGNRWSSLLWMRFNAS